MHNELALIPSSKRRERRKLASNLHMSWLGAAEALPLSPAVIVALAVSLGHLGLAALLALAIIWITCIWPWLSAASVR